MVSEENSPEEQRYCIKCGQVTILDSPTDVCNHTYSNYVELLRPCEALYGAEVNWFLYTIDDDQRTVFVDALDFSGPLQRVGTGGIVLREPQMIVRKWPLNDPENVALFLKTEYKLSEEEATQTIDILIAVNKILSASSSSNLIPYDQLEFSENGCPTHHLRHSAFLEVVDQLGSVPVSKVINEIVLHGQWDARYRF